MYECDDGLNMAYPALTVNNVLNTLVSCTRRDVDTYESECCSTSSLTPVPVLFQFLLTVSPTHAREVPLPVHCEVSSYSFG